MARNGTRRAPRPDLETLRRVLRLREGCAVLSCLLAEYLVSDDAADTRGIIRPNDPRIFDVGAVRAVAQLGELARRGPVEPDAVAAAHEAAMRIAATWQDLAPRFDVEGPYRFALKARLAEWRADVSAALGQVVDQLRELVVYVETGRGRVTPEAGRVAALEARVVALERVLADGGRLLGGLVAVAEALLTAATRDSAGEGAEGPQAGDGTRAAAIARPAVAADRARG